MSPKGPAMTPRASRWGCVALFLLVALAAGAVVAQFEPDAGPFPMVEYFTSLSTDTKAQQDGPSGVGVMFNAVSAFLLDFNSLLVIDNGGGSTVRKVNQSGIFTLAGSPTTRGPASLTTVSVTEALFQMPTGIVHYDGVIYVADTLNDCIRNISNGAVSIMAPATRPAPLAFRMRRLPPDILTSDQSALTLRLFTSPTYFGSAINVGLNVQLIALSDSNDVVYMATQANTFFLAPLGPSPDPVTYPLAENNVDYLGAFAINPANTELFYFGRDGLADAILAIDISSIDPANAASLAAARDLRPRLVMTWTHERITAIVFRNNGGFYAVTVSNVFLITAYTISPPITEPTPEPPRGVAFSGFPMSALPTDDADLMSQLYSWMMKDMGIAFASSDFFMCFEGDVCVPGDVNVSTWGGNITALQSRDGTILVGSYLGPPSVSDAALQTMVNDSPWYWTQLFLASLKNGRDGFCSLACGSECLVSTASPELCINYQPPPACDNVCKGAIASSVVMGVTAAALGGLMVASSANVFTALFMFPVL